MELSIQERLKDLRVERGLTLEQLAEKTHLSKSALVFAASALVFAASAASSASFAFPSIALSFATKISFTAAI